MWQTRVNPLPELFFIHADMPQIKPNRCLFPSKTTSPLSTHLFTTPLSPFEPPPLRHLFVTFTTIEAWGRTPKPKLQLLEL